MVTYNQPFTLEQSEREMMENGKISKYTKDYQSVYQAKFKEVDLKSVSQTDIADRFGNEYKELESLRR